MAHIKRMSDKPRSLPWRAHINRKGHKPIVKMFLNRQEAELWAGEQERSIRLTGLPLTIEELKKHYVKDIVNRYLLEKTPEKGCSVSEATVLKKFLREHPGKDLAWKSLAFVSKKDAYTYINARKKEVKPSTIRREINSIQHVFEVAKEEWGFTNLVNPFRSIPIKGSMHRRKRRLEGDELSRIEAACKKCKGLNQLYIPLAVYLAIETGMRLQEIFNLTWKDIEFKKRRIEIRKSKTDYNSEYAGRTIVLPIVAEVFLQRILVKVMLGKTLPDMPDLPSGKIVKIEPTSLVFPMTKDAFKQAWVHVLRNAGIKNDEDTEDRDFNTEEGLTFHDLRREAGSWFDEAGLTKSEHDLMMGHKSRDMTGLYIGSTLKSIQDKLDRHRLEGKTFEEAYKLALERRKDKADKDMTVEEAVTNVIRIDFGE